MTLVRTSIADGVGTLTLDNPSERTRAVTERLQDLGSRRIDDMNATGIHMQILSLTSPGVQIFAAAVQLVVQRGV